MIFRTNLDRSFFRFVTIHAFDRRTDGRTPFSQLYSPRWHSMQRGEHLQSLFDWYISKHRQ